MNRCQFYNDEMLELVNKILKQLLLTILHKTDKSTLKTNGRIEIFSRDIENRQKDWKKKDFQDLWENIKICVIPGEKKEIDIEKQFWRNNGQKHSKFGERHKFTDSRRLENPKQDKLKEKHVQTHHNETAENQK